MEPFKTFPENNKSTNICKNIGAFKKVQFRTMEDAKEIAAESDFASPKEVATEEPIVAVPTKPGTRNGDLPQLKPGPDGKVDWTPLAEMTGTRPVVNKYSLSRYSLDEWRNRNIKLQDQTKIDESNIVDYNAKVAITNAFGTVDKEQNENNKRLKQRARELYRAKVEVKRAQAAMANEIECLEIDRQRLKGAFKALLLAESISKECIDLRSNRAQPDLVADPAELGLMKEMNMVKEVRDTFSKTLQKIEEQMVSNKAAKHRLEYDWCDKKTAYQLEALNLSLGPKSSTIMFRPGATKFGELTAPLEYWEFFCRETISQSEEVRQRSADLRGGIDEVLIKAGRKLRDQADRTDMALAEAAAITKEVCIKLEEVLKSTLQRIADMEISIENLHNAILKMDAAMKLAQTRLDNRNTGRPHGENVRDQPHLGLIEEVKKIHETVTSLLGQLNNTKRVRSELMKKRIELEKDIAAKRKTLKVDRERCTMVRSHYPSATQIAGY